MLKVFFVKSQSSKIRVLWKIYAAVACVSETADQGTEVHFIQQQFSPAQVTLSHGALATR